LFNKNKGKVVVYFYFKSSDFMNFNCFYLGAAAGATAGYYGAQMQQGMASDTTIRWDGPGYIKTLEGMLKVGAMVRQFCI
jgi:hypothetical protein